MRGMPPLRNNHLMFYFSKYGKVSDPGTNTSLLSALKNGTDLGEMVVFPWGLDGGKAVYGCCQNMQVFYKNSISLGICFVTRKQFGPLVSLCKQQDKELSRDCKTRGALQRSRAIITMVNKHLMCICWAAMRA